MKMIVIAALVLGFQVSAAEKEKKPAKPRGESKELTLPDFSNLEKPAAGSENGVSFSATSECKTNDGQTFKQGDTGFAACMSSKGNQK